MGLRFVAPLALLALTDDEQLGHFYLLTSFYTLVINVGGLEASLYFSQRLLRFRAGGLKRQAVWRRFISTLSLFSLVVAVPATILATQHVQDVSISLMLAFLAFLVLEALANESSRLMWLVDRPWHATRADLVRATGFALSVCLAGGLDGTVLSIWFLVGTSMVNLVVVGWHAASFDVGTMQRSFTAPSLRALAGVVRSGRRCLAYSGAQFLYSQTINLWSFAERSLLALTLSAATLGSYGFASSIIVASITIVLQPTLAHKRSQYLRQARTTQSDAKSLIMENVSVIGLFAVSVAAGVYIGAPIIAIVTGKALNMSWPLAATVALSTVASGTCAQVGIAFDRRRVLILAAFGAATTVGMLLAARFGPLPPLIVIALHSVVQLCLRLMFVGIGRREYR